MTVFAILALLLGIISVLLTGLLCVGFLTLIMGVKVRETDKIKYEIRKVEHGEDKKPGRFNRGSTRR